MKLSEIQLDWSVDSKINELELGREAIKVPTLHSKYLTILSNTKLQLRKAESDYYKLRQLKFRYYRGELTQQELEDNEWHQWQGNKPLKNEMDEFMQCDEDLNNLLDKAEYFKTVIYTLEQILRSINSRTWDIKSAIEWNKFTNGAL
jgi:Recombination, repair and ssDNA binding protein UvsY